VTEVRGQEIAPLARSRSQRTYRRMSSVGRRAPRWLGAPLLVLGANAVVISVFSGVDVYTWMLMLVFGLFATSTNILFGWVGRASFGQAAFFGAGAYAAALLHEWDPELSPLLVLLAALAVGALLGAPILLLLRGTSGITFATITLIAAQILYQVVFTNRGLGGETGLSGITVTSVFGLDLFGYVPLSWYIAAVVAVCLLLLYRLSESSFGVTLRAVRDDEIKAAIMGIPVRRAQAAAFVLAGAFGAVAGALLAQVQTSVSAELLNWTVSGTVVVMCLLGGRHRFFGPFVGAIVYEWVQTVFLHTAALSDLLVGLVFLAIVLVVPDGILGTLSRAGMMRMRSRWQEAWKSRHGPRRKEGKS
jgi:branched-chain amino acid transport system permease protein